MLNLFNEILLLSIIGSLTAVGILLIKKLFNQKLSAQFHYYVWFILIIRLIIPFTLSNPIQIFHFIPQTQTQNSSFVWNISGLGSKTIDAGNNDLDTNIDTNKSTNNADITMNNDTDNINGNDAFNNNAFGNAVNNDPINNQIIAKNNTTKPATFLSGLGFNLKTAALIWFIVFIAILIYICIVNLMLILKLQQLSLCERQDITDILNLCKSRLNMKATVSILYDNQLKSPMLCGYVHPKILINPEIIKDLTYDELRYVFLHELSHLKRKDLITILLGMVLQAFYWFNPIILYSIHQMKKDCEIACDASVLSVLNEEENKKYGQTIISLLTILSNSNIVPGTLGFTNKYNVRRITMITQFKKTSATFSIIALMCILILTGCSSLTHSGEGKNTAETSPSQNASAMDSSPNASGDNSKAPDSNEDAVIQAYKAVLQNKAEYYSTDNKKNLYLNDFLTNQELYKVSFKISHFTVLDMDHDNIPEVVLELTVNGNNYPSMYEILHYSDGKIYGYMQVFKGLELLKTDGTFHYSNGVFDNGYGQMIFSSDSCSTNILGNVTPNQDATGISSYLIDNNSVSEVTYKSFLNEQGAKKDVDWYEFTQENIVAIKTGETVAAPSISATQPDMQDSIIYIVDISASLRGIDRYSLTENGEIINTEGYYFDNYCRYFNTDQTELDFHEFSSIVYKQNRSGTFVKCKIRSAGRTVKEAYLLD